MKTPTRTVARGRAHALLILSFASLVSVAPAATAGAASPAELAPGTRVRIEAPGLSLGDGTGTINAVGDRDIRLLIPGRAEPVTIARDQITRFQVSSNRGSRLSHALIGGALGAIGGALVAKNANSQWQYPGIKALMAAASALVGAGIGAALPAGERWRDVPVARYRVALVPNPGSGFGLSVSRGF